MIIKPEDRTRADKERLKPSMEAQKLVNDFNGSSCAMLSQYPVRAMKAIELNKLHREELMLYITILEDKIKRHGIV